MRFRMSSGITFSEVAVSSFLLAALLGVSGAGWKGRLSTEKERGAISAMTAATQALLVYAQDHEGGLPQAESTAVRLLGQRAEGPAIALNQCVSTVRHENPLEVVVLTALVGDFEDINGRIFRPLRLAMTDSAAAKAVHPEEAWKVFEPQDSSYLGGAPYGTTEGAIRIWHPASFRMTPVYKEVCSPDKVKGPMDRPTFVPAADAADYYETMAEISGFTAGTMREMAPQ